MEEEEKKKEKEHDSRGSNKEGTNVTQSPSSRRGEKGDDGGRGLDGITRQRDVVYVLIYGKMAGWAQLW